MYCSRPGPDMKITGYQTRCVYEADWIVTPMLRDIRGNVAGRDMPMCSVHLMAFVTEMMNDGLKRFAGFAVRRSDVPAPTVEAGRREIEQ